jgi:RNA polymerase sigma-70 factor, ECF subfamily
VSTKSSASPASVTGTLDSVEFERNFRAVQPTLRKYANSLARDQDVAQDLVQEVALRAWAARERFEIGTNFNAWCYRILRNCFLTQVRRQKVARTESRGYDLPEVPVAPDQEVALELQEVVRNWGRLTIDQQRSLALVGMEGHSYEAAAAIDEVPLGTMKSRVTRARYTLIALLNGELRPTDEGAIPHECDVQQSLDAASTEVPPVTADATDRAQVELLRAWRERRRTAALAIAA